MPIMTPEHVARAQEHEMRMRAAVQQLWTDVAKRVYVDLVTQERAFSIAKAAKAADPLGIADLPGDDDEAKAQEGIAYQLDLRGPLAIAFQSADLFVQTVMERNRRLAEAAKDDSEANGKPKFDPDAA